MEKQGVLQFDIEGEYLTSLAREWFYVEGKGYDKCIELLNGCMSGTDETKEQIRRHAEDLLLGRAALKGSTREGSYHLEIYGPESEEKMPEYMNVWDIVGEQKEVKAMKDSKSDQVDYSLLEYYKTLGTPKECREAREKQKPHKVKFEPWMDTKCVCGYEFSRDLGDGYHDIPIERKTKYCPDCGQKLQWDDKE